MLTITSIRPVSIERDFIYPTIKSKKMLIPTVRKKNVQKNNVLIGEYKQNLYSNDRRETELFYKIFGKKEVYIALERLANCIDDEITSERTRLLYDKKEMIKRMIMNGRSSISSETTMKINSLSEEEIRILSSISKQAFKTMTRGVLKNELEKDPRKIKEIVLYLLLLARLEKNLKLIGLNPFYVNDEIDKYKRSNIEKGIISYIDKRLQATLGYDDIGQAIFLDLHPDAANKYTFSFNQRILKSLNIKPEYFYELLYFLDSKVQSFSLFYLLFFFSRTRISDFFLDTLKMSIYQLIRKEIHVRIPPYYDMPVF